MKQIDLGNKSLAILPVFAKQVVDDSCVIIFLHEALGSIGQWKVFPQLVCNSLGLNGVIYEREGYGDSTPLQYKRGMNYLHEYALNELPALLDKILPKEKKVLLVGHSDGASIALLFAAHFPERLEGVVSMAAHVIVEEVTIAGIAPAKRAFIEGKLEGLRKYHGDKTDQLFYAWADTWNLPEFRDWNICEELATITCPVLAIQGANDQYGTEKQLDLIQQSISKALTTKNIVTNCGHHPHLEKTEKVISTIANWFVKVFN